MNHPVVTSAFRSECPEGFLSRTYSDGYPSFDDEMDANLYYWIRQSFRILWSLEVESVCIYENVVRKLTMRLSPQLKPTMPVSAIPSAVAATAQALALADFELCASRSNLHEQQAAIMENAAHHLSNDPDALTALGVFSKKFARTPVPL